MKLEITREMFFISFQGWLLFLKDSFSLFTCLSFLFLTHYVHAPIESGLESPKWVLRSMTSEWVDDGCGIFSLSLLWQVEFTLYFISAKNHLNFYPFQQQHETVDKMKINFINISFDTAHILSSPDLSHLEAKLVFYVYVIVRCCKRWHSVCSKAKFVGSTCKLLWRISSRHFKIIFLILVIQPTRTTSQI
jgi:hypothetical protein